MENVFHGYFHAITDYYDMGVMLCIAIGIYTILMNIHKIPSNGIGIGIVSILISMNGLFL